MDKCHLCFQCLGILFLQKWLVQLPQTLKALMKSLFKAYDHLQCIQISRTRSTKKHKPYLLSVGSYSMEQCCIGDILSAFCLLPTSHNYPPWWSYIWCSLEYGKSGICVHPDGTPNLCSNLAQDDMGHPTPPQTAQVPGQEGLCHSCAEAWGQVVHE